MANLSVRNLDDEVHAALRERAERAGHSMEAEIRRILTAATSDDLPNDPFLRLLARVERLGGADLDLPGPDYGSPIDFSGAEFG